MKLSQQWKSSKIVLYVVLFLVLLAILFLPFGLAFLDLPYQIFIISLLVFFIIYAKVIAGYSFVASLLSLIDKWEDVYDHISSKLSKDSLYKYLVDGDLLVLTETQLLKVAETESTLNDISLVFLLAMTVVYLSWWLAQPLFYAVLFALFIVWLIQFFVGLYASLKFARVFSSEMEDIEKAFKEWNTLEKANEIEQNNEESDKEEQNNEQEEKVENKQ